jgi:hypothetical protein
VAGLLKQLNIVFGCISYVFHFILFQLDRGPIERGDMQKIGVKNACAKSAVHRGGSYGSITRDLKNICNTCCEEEERGLDRQRGEATATDSFSD